MSVDVAKHQRGKHDQAAHGAWAKGSGLREGWSQRSKEDVLAEFQTYFRGIYPNDREHADNMAEEFASWTTKYDGPNGTVVTVDLRSKFGGDTSPDTQTMDTALWTLTRLQKQNPVKDLQVEFSDKPFRDEADILPADADGFVIRGEKKINMRPRYATDIGMSQVRDDGHFMPAAENVSKVEYYLTHEYGHVRDTRGRGQVADDIYRLASLETSGYGASNEYEKYAEAYAEWSLTNGETTNETAQTYAKKYFWADNMQKAAGDNEIERIIIVDTFEAGNPPSIVKLPDDVVKHQRGKHDQSAHGRRAQRRRDLSAAAEAQTREQQALAYLLGDRPFPPDYSTEGVPPPMRTITGTLREMAQGAKKRVARWRQEREQRALRQMTPQELSALGAANRAREAARRAMMGFPPVVYKSADPALRLLYRVFSDIVEPELWTALVDDPRPLVELDGPLGELLDEMLGAVMPDSTVIKLMPGLRPMLKHEGGGHDQKSHGAWARGSSGEFSQWGDRAERIRAMRDIGPDLRGVANVFQKIEDGSFDEFIEERILDDYSEMVEFEINDRREYIQSRSQQELMDDYGTPARQYVDALVAQGKSESAAIEQFRDMKMFEVEGQVKRQTIRDAKSDFKAQLVDDLQSRIEPGIREAFEISHPVTIDGYPDSINTHVEIVEVDLYYGRPTVTIKGSILNDDGYQVGDMFEREIRLAEDSTAGNPKLEAENKFLRLTDDRYQRQGFATTFNERSYDMYIANGMDTVKVGTAWDGGAVWAKRGFDWNDNFSKQNKEVAERALSYIVNDPSLPQSTNARAASMLVNTRNATDVTDPRMPTPMEIVMLGYTPGASKWSGYTAMYDSRWQGEKLLTPSNVAETKSKKDKLKEVARQEREVAGQKKLFVPSRTSTVGGTVGEPVDATTGEILDLLEPVGGVPRVRTPEGAAKYGKPIGAPIVAKAKMSRWDKLQAQMEFYEKWLVETNRELDDDDPEVERQFFMAAAEAMPWLID